MRGDALASGGKSATFGGPSGISQAKWDAIFGPATIKRCKSAGKYKGLRPPTCNGGNPCEACLEIYRKAQGK